MIKIKFLARIFCIKILFCNHNFSPLNTFTRKEKDANGSGSGSVLVTNGTGAGRTKNMQIRT